MINIFITIIIMLNTITIMTMIMIKVDVEEHELGGFLKTATGLQIKGLSDDQSGQVIKLLGDHFALCNYACVVTSQQSPLKICDISNAR